MKLSNAMKATLLAPVFGVLALGAASTSAVAATSVNTTFAVTATVQSTCIISATAMGFGTYVSTAASTSASAITVTCTNTTPYTLGLDAGQTTGATETTRQMKNGAALLNYALFSDSGRTANWGNTTGSWVSGTGNGSAQAITVYGQAAAGQYVTPGAYSDTITATVTY
jgi:spore coat protein U-like protein